MKQDIEFITAADLNTLNAIANLIIIDHENAAVALLDIQKKLSAMIR